MGIFRARGGNALRGVIDVRGSKNAATPMAAAALLTAEPVTFHNVPRIADFFRMVELLESAGAETRWIGEHTLRIRAANVDPETINGKLVGHLRSSVLLLGALLGRTRRVRLPHPGGCRIGARPVTTHLRALSALGVATRETPEGIEASVPPDALNRRRRDIVLREFSVTATENLLLYAATIPGTTVIHCSAAEPHVQTLAALLRAMGARVEGEGTNTITVEGGDLGGAETTIPPDPIEAGTFLILGALRGRDITVRNVPVDHLRRFLVQMEDCGIRLEITERQLDGLCAVRAHGGTLRAVPFETRPWPGIPTDLQAPLSVLATQCEGTTLIHETLYENRFQHLRELERMGAAVIIHDPHRALVTGPTPLYAQEIRSFDLRAGATLIIAALIAEGESVIHDSEQVDRGYETIDQRLRAVGADIRREP